MGNPPMAGENECAYALNTRYECRAVTTSLLAAVLSEQLCCAGPTPCVQAAGGKEAAGDKAAAMDVDEPAAQEDQDQDQVCCSRAGRLGGQGWLGGGAGLQSTQAAVP